MRSATAIALAALLSTALAAGGGLPTRPGERIEGARGTIVRVGETWFGIVPDADAGTRYAPEKLAKRFREDGLRVAFSGVLTEPPRGVRLWGTPLRLTAIRALEEPPAAADRSAAGRGVGEQGSRSSEGF